MVYSGVSAVILTYNTDKGLLQSCLRTLYSHNDIGSDLEVIVVDNNSINQDELESLCRQEYGNVLFIRNTDNRGYGAGNNVGIRAATHEIVLLINPDVELVEPIFNWAMDMFEKRKELALLGMQQRDQFGKKVHSFLIRRLTVGNFITNQINQKMNRFAPEISVISGACFFLKKSPFFLVGGYDEDMFLYSEERYLHERVLKRFLPKSIVMNFNMSYRHAIANRPFSIATSEMAFRSYFYIQQKLGIQYNKIYKQVLNYHRFLILFYIFKCNIKEVGNLKEIICLLKQKFSK